MNVRRLKYSGPALILFFTVMSAMFAPGADALEVSAQVDRTSVDLEGRVVLTVTVEGAGRQGADVDLGATDAFHVYSAGTSQNISIVNGKFSATHSYKYILTPRRTGSFQLGPIAVQEGGERATAASITIEVVESKADAGSPQPSRTGSGRRSSGSRPPEVMIKTVVDKKEAYVGEAITLTFQLFTRVRFWSDPEYTPAPTKGFWKEDLPPQNRYDADLDGVRYRVTEIKSALFPTQRGELTIGPAGLIYEGNATSLGDPSDIFSRNRRGIFGGRSRRTLETDPISIQVLPLPAAGRPPGFTGTVGDFTFRASIDRSEVKANEAISMTVDISGEGNIRTANLPPLELSESFKVYDSGTSTDISKENYRVRGKKTYTRVIVPRYGGEYVLPPVSFSFFDPKRKKYITRSSPEFPIEVDGPAHNPDREKTVVARQESDLRYLKDGSDLRWSREGKQFPVLPVAAANLLPLLLIGAAYALRKRRDRLNIDQAWARKRQADGAARKSLSRAKDAIENGDAKQFTTLLSQAVQDYIRDKGDIPVGGLTRRKLLGELDSRGVHSDLTGRLERLLIECDHGRFAERAVDREKRLELLREGEEIILIIGRVIAGGGRK